MLLSSQKLGFVRRPSPCLRDMRVQSSSPRNKDEIKNFIIQSSGSKYGHDLDQITRTSLENAANQLTEDNVKLLPLTGTSWVPVYTNSIGPSSGKVGPFITEVSQEFPAETPGTYFNISRLGPLCARLEGEYKLGVTAKDKVDLEFKTLTVSFGPLQIIEKKYNPGQMVGFWRVTYCDKNFRVFFTNKGSIFIMRKI